MFEKLLTFTFCYVILILGLRKLIVLPACRNGRRGRLKICCVHARAGSSPAAGIPWQGRTLEILYRCKISGVFSFARRRHFEFVSHICCRNFQISLLFSLIMYYNRKQPENVIGECILKEVFSYGNVSYGEKK